MKILMIAGSQSEAALRRHLPHDHAYYFVPITGLVAGWDGASLKIIRLDDGHPLDGYDAVYLHHWGRYESMARCVAFYTRFTNTPALNVQLLDTWPVTKISELCRLTAAGVPHPRTFFTPQCENLPSAWRRFRDVFDVKFPVVVKAIGASRGKFNFKADSEEELLPLDRRWTYLVQEYVPNDGDYRILVVGGRPAVAIRRERQSDRTHLNNTAAGGTTALVALDSLDPHWLDIAVEAAKAMGRESFSGVDLLIDSVTQQPYVLEVNLCPDLVNGAEIESVTAKVQAVVAELQRLSVPSASDDGRSVRQ
jgi:glutathione synthase/RimK-type ligase-like ATP-grasp enzyme